MAREPAEQYLLPPLHFEHISTWSPFEAGQPPVDGEVSQDRAPPIGLGIHAPPEDGTSRGHYRSESNLTTDTQITEADISERPSRYGGSEATLLDKQLHHHGHSPEVRCPTNKTIVHRRLSWIPITIIVLATYATVFSGIYLVVASLKPRYGRFIGAHGRVAPSTASLLSALFAKTIELAYVTVCVAFLGQVLSHRALMKGSRGISISDMSMRLWITQPGSMIVHWQSLRYSGLTVLGLITLTATLVAMLYTTAAQALVSPKLVMGPVQARTLFSDVYTQWANPFYIKAQCNTPIPTTVDPLNRNSTCLDLEHAGQAYHNYQAYLKAWTAIASATNHSTPSSTSMGHRPLPTGSIHDNTTITGSWIDHMDMTELSHKYGRLVINVTAAMPHAGVIEATTNARNRIQHPPDLSGEGNYMIEASVPSPAVNVLCVGMNRSELTPLVYREWPLGEQYFNPVEWTMSQPGNIPEFPRWLNRTVVDEIFGFGPLYGQRPPIFGKFPGQYDTLLNTTGYWPANAIYLLGASPPGIDPEYIMCALRAKQTPHCSTHYAVSGHGAQFSTRCEDPDNPLQYSNRAPDAQDGYWSGDWKNVAAEWATSLSLGTGITNGRASNSHLLMQLIPQNFSLDPRLPSISEALAVMAGNTLIMSSTDAPFVTYWTHPNASLTEPDVQSFPATVQVVEYASGGTEAWQGIFYVILTFAFITSAICLTFMLVEVRGRQLTDFTEPQNLFALAMNSPATTRLTGACGGGPQGRQLDERWYVAMEEDDQHYYIRTKAEEDTPVISTTHSNKHNKQFAPVPLDDEEEGRNSLNASGRSVTSPAMDEYRRLSARRSFLSRWY